jgi:hypothetical protein
MQKEITSRQAAPGAGAPIQILGVNAAGQESANALMSEGRVLPLLQDRSDVDAWGLWRVEYRDVVILDTQNRPVAVYNLTLHDLADTSDYAELKALLLEKAAR